MYQSDFEEFKTLISDVCTAFNRPFTDDLVRVFWEALKAVPIARFRVQVKHHMATGKKFPAPLELKPEPEPPRPVSHYTSPDPSLDQFDGFANRCLMKFLLSSPGQIDAPTLQALVNTKARLAADFRALNREQEVSADHVREALMRAFERVTAQEAAA